MFLGNSFSHLMSSISLFRVLHSEWMHSFNTLYSIIYLLNFAMTIKFNYSAHLSDPDRVREVSIIKH